VVARDRRQVLDRSDPEPGDLLPDLRRVVVDERRRAEPAFGEPAFGEVVMAVVAPLGEVVPPGQVEQSRRP